MYERVTRTSNYWCQSQFLLFHRVNMVPVFLIGIQNPSQKINEIPTPRDEIAIVFSDYEKNHHMYTCSLFIQ